MITIGYNQVQEKHVADTNSTRREDAHEAKKVYVGNKLAHVHVNDNTEFALRQTLNGYIHEDNDLYAKVRSIKGNTKVWNQLANINQFVGQSEFNTLTTDGSNLRVTIIADNTQSWRCGIRQNPTISTIVGHVYYHSYEINPSVTVTISSDIWGTNTSTVTAAANTWTKYSIITTATVSYTFLLNRVLILNANDYYLYRAPILIDLTLIYGAGNEPTTVAEFEADFQKWFGRPIGAEPYDAGSLIPFVGTGIKSTGFNLWDEEWEAGGINSSTGENDDSVVNKIRAKNFISVLAAEYYFKNPTFVEPNYIAARYYDSNYKYIGYLDFNESQLLQGNRTFVPPINARYIKFMMPIGYGATYNHDICINLSNPTLNGTYVPYKATTVPIPVTTLTGKAEGSTTSEVIFPDGMKSAGSVKDEVYVEDGKTYAVKRVGSLDLGTATLLYDYSVFFIPKYALPAINSKLGDLFNGLQSKYNHIPNAGINPTELEDKVFVNHNNYIKQSCIIKDSAYTDVTTFKAAMAGVMLYYELATPIVYEVDNYTLPLYYPANGTGTEELQSTATTAPADMDIEYRLRQRVRLVDMGTPGVLWADSDIDITKPDGFCDSAFTYDKSFFSWGNVAGHNPISNTAFDYDWGSINQAEPWYENQVYGSTPGSTLTGNIPADALYDAAKAVLGGNWRMPSNAEYGALFRICKFLEADGTDMDTSKTDKRVDMPDGNGGTVKGIYIESTVTGNRLFFSCSGHGNGRSWYNRGSSGNYWSSAWSSARSARYLSFNSGGVTPQNYNYRYYGFALRPVYPISQ